MIGKKRRTYMYAVPYYIMEQSLKQEFDLEQVSSERSIGNLFAEFLESKKLSHKFESLKDSVLVSLDGEILHSVVDGKTTHLRLSNPEVLKMVVQPDQEVRFIPAVAGG